MMIAAVAVLFAGAVARAPPPPVEPMIGKPGCETSCGNVSVPFPFGFGPARCSGIGFNLTCDNTTRPGKPRLLLGTFEVKEISTENKTVRVVTPPIFSRFRNLSSSPGAVMRVSSWGIRDSNDDGVLKLSAPSEENSWGTELVVVGCNVEATLHIETPSGSNYVVGCSSYCDGDRALTAEYVQENCTGYCSSSDMGLNFGDTYFDVQLKRLQQRDRGTINDDLPVSVFIVDGDFMEPVLPEWAVHLMNLDTPRGISIIIGVSCGTGIILLVIISIFISKILKRQRAKMLRRKFFEKNHGKLLEQLVSQNSGIPERMIITLDELEKATHNFEKDLVVGSGGQGTVYKGILSNQHIVAIKKPMRMDRTEIDAFINEVAILSQINHRNVVKLYGCCLETEVPMLIYEFISNGTLSEHLHVEGPRSLSWDNRLRIAIEAAKSIAYLHSTTSTPIIHRDIKSANILLDDSLTTKVADFGASRNIPIEKSGLTTKVQGTRGYWDPACFHTGRLTEKSDVFSFGIVLMELLTRKKPYSYLSSDGDALIVHFSTLFAQGNLLQILDPQVVEEGAKEAEVVATLVVACIKFTPEDRPTMRQVELTLESIRSSQVGTLDNTVAENVFENDIAIDVLYDVDRSNERSIRRYSMEEEFALSARYPR